MDILVLPFARAGLAIVRAVLLVSLAGRAPLIVELR